MQFDEAERGFSFRAAAPLDMRMDPTRGESAADFLATADERTIADTIYELGEEKKSRRIARAIVALREAGTPVRDTARPRRRRRARRARAAARPHPPRDADVSSAPHLRQRRARRAARRARGRARPDGGRRTDRRHQLSLARGPHREAHLSRRLARARRDAQTDRRRSRTSWRRTRARAAPSCASPSAWRWRHDRRNAPRSRSTSSRRAPPPSCAASTARATRPNAARRRTRRRMHRPVFAVVTLAVAILLPLLAYVTLTANLTSLNYALARAEHKRTALLEETQRLDDRIARLQSPDRLAALAAPAEAARPARLRGRPASPSRKRSRNQRASRSSARGFSGPR